jgi:hypothetical protein
MPAFALPMARTRRTGRTPVPRIDTATQRLSACRAMIRSRWLSYVHGSRGDRVVFDHIVGAGY